MMIRENITKRKLRAGETVFGIFLPIPAPRIVELCGLAGFDYVILDAEHGPIDIRDCEEMIRAAELVNMTPIVRVPDHEPKTILRFLDSGAQGVMVPLVNSAADARKIVEAVKYGPLGKRGIAPGRAAAYGQEISTTEWARHANAETMVIVMIEHIDALAELQGIVAVEGIDAFEIGTSDLSQSMGFPGEPSRPEVQAVVDQFVAGVLGVGGIIGDTATNPEMARDWMKQGYRMIDCSFPRLAMAGMRAFLSTVRDSKG